jgi:hypothetical protein
MRNDRLSINDELVCGRIQLCILTLSLDLPAGIEESMENFRKLLS